MLVNLSIGDYALKLASPEAAPGGGSAAALSGLMGASLMEMVINLSLGRKEFAEFEGELADKQTELAKLHGELQRLVDHDAVAFNAVMEAYKLPKASETEKQARSAAIQEAMVNAAEVPLQTARACLAVMRIGRELLGKINPHAVSDLMVGAFSCHTGIMGALLNIAINIPMLRDQAIVTAFASELKNLRSEADATLDSIEDRTYAERTFALMRE